MKRRVVGSLLLAGMAAFVLAACGEGDKAAADAKKKKGGPKHLVEVVTTKNTPLTFEVTRTGTLSARKSVRVFNQEEGRVDRVPVREGDVVKSGQIIIEMDSKLITASLDKAVATRQEAEGNLARVLELSKRQVATQERLDKAETALSVAKAEESLISTRLDYARIRAPFGGIVTERHIEPGDVAPRYSHLLTLIDPNSLFTSVSVSELMLPHLRVESPIDVRIDALGDKVWTGRIVRIHPAVDPRTRQGIVEVNLDPVPPGASAGQLCRVKLKTPEVTRLVIPFASLRHDREGDFVFLIENEKAAVRRVLPGLRLEDRVEILDGLKAGDQVVVRGFLDLTPGKAVSVVGAEESGDKKGGAKNKKNGEGADAAKGAKDGAKDGAQPPTENRK